MYKKENNMEIDFDKIEENGGPSECVCDGAGHCPVYQQFIHRGVQYQCQRLQSSRNQWWRIFRPDYSEEGRKKFEEAKRIATSKAKFDKAVKELDKKGINPDSIEGKKGLGTVITKILAKIGVTKDVVSTVAGIDDCGCDRREEWLNKIFSKGEIND